MKTSHSNRCLIGKKETVRENSALRVSGREDSNGRDRSVCARYRKEIWWLEAENREESQGR